MTIAEKLFVAVLQDGDIQSFYKIQKAWLESSSESKVLVFMRKYFRDNDRLPPTEVIFDKFPGLSPITGSAKHYLKELIDRYTYNTLATKIPTIIKGLKDDAQGTLDGLRSLVAGLSLNEDTEDIPYHLNADKRIDRYNERVGTNGVTYLSMNDPVLDSITYGYHRGDLTTIGGRAGMGKTWLLCVLAVLCESALTEADNPVLFVTNEMTAEDIIDRIDCIRFKLPYEKFLQGNLSPDELKRYKMGLHRLRTKGSKMNVIYNCSTLDEYEAKVRIYQPSVVFLDGSYLLEPRMEEGFAKTTYITRNLKAIAKATEIPCWNTTQLRKKMGRGANKSSIDGQDEFYYGSYVQDSDYAIRMFQDPNMVYQQVIGLDFVKGRKIRPNTVIEYSPDLVSMSFGFSATLGVATSGTLKDTEDVEF